MNKNLLLAGGLLVLATIVYFRKNKNQEMSSACGSCSGANGQNWN